VSQDRGSIIEQHPSRRTSNLEADHGTRGQQLGAKSLRLPSSAIG
jgi:hypothetical protein